MKRLTEQLGEDRDRADLTPMIDCIFLLLLFFIVTATFSEEKLLDIELPTINNANTELIPSESLILLSISRQGNYMIEGRPIGDEQLYAELEQYALRGVKTLIVSGDQKCPYGKVVMALDVAKGLDIFDYSFVLESP